MTKFRILPIMLLFSIIGRGVLNTSEETGLTKETTHPMITN